MKDKLEISEISISSIPEEPNGELHKNAIRWCAFCQKEVGVCSTNNLLCKLSGPNNFYCSFCLRHQYHTRNSKHILPFSFRGLVGYYYHEFYLGGRAKISLCEIEDYLSLHANIGLANPVFSYDPDTMLWFVDFLRVGNSKKKILIEDVLKTISDILNCFQLAERLPGLKIPLFYDKYKEAILNFYMKRYRPEGRYLLVPTLVNCGLMDYGKQGTMEKLRNFTSKNMILTKIL